MSRRYDHASTDLTSNNPFEEWGDVCGDEVMAGALIDRLVQRCHVASIRGNSDRMREHRALASRPSLPSECAPAPERVRTVLRAMASTLIASEDTLGEVLQAHVVVDHGHDQSQVHLFTRDHLRLLAALR